MGPDLPTMPEKIVFAPCGHVAEGALASICIGRGECPDTKPEEIDGLVALAKVYEIEVDQ
jgi:hypothetical protein